MLGHHQASWNRIWLTRESRRQWWVMNLRVGPGDWHRQDQKNHKSKFKVKVTVIKFFDVKRLPIVCFCYGAKQSSSMASKKYSDVCFIQCSRRSERCSGATFVCFTTSKCLLTMPWTSNSSWPRRTSSY